MSSEPTTRPPADTNEPSALSLQKNPGDGGHGRGVHASEKNRQDDDVDGGAQGGLHGFTIPFHARWSASTIQSMSFDSDERHDDSADAVDPEIAGEDPGGPERPVANALQARAARAR